MSVNIDYLYPTGRVVRLPRKGPPAQGNAALGLDAFTQRFFLEGEEQEANGYKNLFLDDGARISPEELAFESFDKIPRKRLPLLIMTGLTTLVAFSVAGWIVAGGLPGLQSLYDGMRRPRTWETAPATTAAVPPPVDSPATPMPAVAIGATEPFTTATMAQVPAASLRLPATKPLDASRAILQAEQGTVVQEPPKPPVAEGQNTGALVESPEGKASSRPESPVDLEQRAGQRADVAAVDPIDAPRSKGSTQEDRPLPLHGYVWSPASQTLVPADGADEATEAAGASAEHAALPTEAAPAASEPSAAAPILD
jgi:hypothetical protein